MNTSRVLTMSPCPRGTHTTFSGQEDRGWVVEIDLSPKGDIEPQRIRILFQGVVQARLNNEEDRPNEAERLSGKAYERAFNDAAANYLAPGSLRPPKLSLMTDRLGSLPLEALDTTDRYLGSTGLQANRARFLMNALDSGATIINHYMDFTGDHAIAPVNATQLLRSAQTPAWPRPQPSY